MIAVNDGKILKVGDNARLGHYIVLQDATGNVYTYSQLGSVSRKYPVPKPVKLNRQATSPRSSPRRPASRRRRPASAGSQVTKLASRRRRPRRRAPATSPAAPRGLDDAARRSRRRPTGSDDVARDADGQGAAVRQPGPRLPRTPPAATCSCKNSGQTISSFQQLLRRHAAPGPQPVHAQAAEGRLDRRRGHDPGSDRGPVAARLAAPLLPGPPGRQERAADRSQADPRWLEAARGHRRLPRRRRRPVLRSRRQEPRASARCC